MKCLLHSLVWTNFGAENSIIDQQYCQGLPEGGGTRCWLSTWLFDRTVTKLKLKKIIKLSSLVTVLYIFLNLQIRVIFLKCNAVNRI